MRILWLSSTVLPTVCEELGIKGSASGGWIEGAAKRAVIENDLHIVAVYPIKEMKKLKKDSTAFYVIPSKSAKSNKVYFEEIIKDVSPEIIHIWGTEYLHNLDMIEVCEKLGVIDKVVLSIQGVCGIIAKHYYAGLPWKVINRYTLKDMIMHKNIRKEKKIFQQKSEKENIMLKKVKHVIGRTEWDKACVTQINPEINYHFCNETLRDAFYNNMWDYEKCEKHSLFVSQGYYPLKGLHFVLEALAMLKKEFPDIKLYIGGTDMVNRGWKTASYGKYIKELIKKYDLRQNIQFTGMLNEQKMCEQYLKANVFVSASSIENESNSLSEASILGVPSVVSYVGGVISRIGHGERGFVYQYDAPYMLAYYVKQMFYNKELAIKMGEKAREYAVKTHNRDENLKTLLSIYSIIKGENR